LNKLFAGKSQNQRSPSRNSATRIAIIVPCTAKTFAYVRCILAAMTQLLLLLMLLLLLLQNVSVNERLPFV
jgi:hypothetical protein